MSKYALLGRGISYSFSPSFFKEKFKKLGLRNHHYELMDLPNLDTLKDEVSTRNLKGFNVTQPYKEKILPFLDALDETAQEIGAVNCVKITDGKWIGFNTDAYGFKKMIHPFIENKFERVMILGKGGASKAVAHVFEKWGIEVFYARRKAENEKEFSYSEIGQGHINAFKIIVNTTPLGTFPNIDLCPDLPYEFLTKEHFLIDLIYNPPLTTFLKKGKIHEAQVLNGADMLKLQAEKSWKIWND
ncbi:MAG: shikimate dehydrogenase [Flavobacteriales bacterium]|jgi:shikimate dehydrogenase|nr:shikimate dehydrogenase [Flavobacteriales bacterium]